MKPVKILKILLLGLGAVSFFATVVVIVLLHKLPSPARLGQYLPKKKPEIYKPLPSYGVEKKDEPQIQTEKKSKSIVEPNDLKIPDEEAKVAFDLNNEKSQKIMEELLDPNQPLVNVCAYLENAKEGRAEGYDSVQFAASFEKSALTNEKDPFIQSLKPILKYTMGLSEMGRLIEMATQARDVNSEDFIDKAAFYSQGLLVYNEILDEKSNLENLTDRTYFLFMINKIAAKYPSLANDSGVYDFCRSIEANINQNQSFDLENTKQEFERFLANASISGKDIGYNPNYKTDLTIEMMDSESGGVQLRGGWLDQIVKP